MADFIASWFVPVVVTIAAATAATWLGLGLSGTLNPALLPPGTTPGLLALLHAGGQHGARRPRWRVVHRVLGVSFNALHMRRRHGRCCRR
jgi:hypothetical protein